MRELIIIGLLICSKLSIAQSDSSKYYIKKLNWNSFAITTNYVPMLVLKEDAKRVIAIDSKSKVDKLIKCLADKEKTVVVHVILTQMFEPDASKFSQIYNYAKDSAIVSVQYEYNGLNWNWSNNLGYKINKKDIEVVRKYWIEKRRKR